MAELDDSRLVEVPLTHQSLTTDASKAVLLQRHALELERSVGVISNIEQ